MSGKSLTYMLLTLVLVIYLGAALYVTAMNSDAEVTGGVRINVSDAPSGFVTASQVERELKAAGTYPAGTVINRVDLTAMENTLNSIDNIEHVTAYRSFTGKGASVVVDVTPMKPVARIFDGERSYYVNRSGKRLTANCIYRVDVPVVIGHFDSIHPATEILPLIDYMAADRNFADFVTAVEVNRCRDIILYPMHTGPVINFGDTLNIKNKIHRLMRMYESVIPVVGAEFYDTLSVKWNGQVVATRHKKPEKEPPIFFDTEIEPERVNLGYLDTVPDVTNHEEP